MRAAALVDLSSPVALANSRSPVTWRDTNLATAAETALLTAHDFAAPADPVPAGSAYFPYRCRDPELPRGSPMSFPAVARAQLTSLAFSVSLSAVIEASCVEI
jgi:hypothetical protein